MVEIWSSGSSEFAILSKAVISKKEKEKKNARWLCVICQYNIGRFLQIFQKKKKMARPPRDNVGGQEPMISQLTLTTLETRDIVSGPTQM